MSRRRCCLVAILSLAGSLLWGGAAQASSPAQSPGPQPPAATAATNPYGNPFNDYLRQPYGVLDSPQQQSSLPPVQDNPNEPFDWYRYPRAAIGVYGGPERSIITPEGYLQNEFADLTFSTGADRTPVDQRVKTWQDGYLPIMDERFSSGGVEHAIDFFAAKVPGVIEVPYTQSYGLPAKTVTADVANMVDFVRVTLTNPSDSAITHRFSATLKLGAGIGALNGNAGPSVPADPAWDATSHAYGGDGKLLMVAHTAPTATDGATADYDLTLAPHQTKTLDFTLPYFVGQQSDTAAVAGADYDAYHDSTAAFWHRTLDEAGTTLTIPGSGVETKVLDAYKANLAFSLLLMNVVGGRYFWNANPTVYDHYWIRDTAFDINGILNAGLTDVAKQVTLEMLDWQAPSGQFISQYGENDGNGEALWAFANYYDRTHDQAFAEQVWPAVQRAMDWEWQIRSANWSTDGGLFPSSSMSDNEGVRGHVLTYDLWNIAGEQGAVDIANAVGDTAAAQAWTARRSQYVDILRGRLAPVVQQLGFIPPAVEGMSAPAIRPGWYGNVYGIDWGNLEAVWPSGAFAADDPWITQSLAAWQAKTFEGVFGYPSGGVEGTLHSYTPMSLSVTDVFRGDQQAALSSLYSLLVHTSAADMTSEGMDSAQRWGWSQTDQTQPHAEFSGKYLTFLRDMLVNEYGGSLHLANVWSPVWNKPGARLGFDGETDFGHVSYTATVDSGGSTVALNPPTRNAPKSIVLSAPAGYALTSVTVDGQPAGTLAGNEVTLPPLQHPASIRLNWTRKTATPPYSFARAVSDYLANYHKMTSPPDVRIENTAAGHPTVRAGYPLQVTSTVVNSGGAGYLGDPRVRLYVDGKPTQTDARTLAKGIGFTTPDSVITFGHHDEGTVPVAFTTTLCAPGMHTFGIALGDSAPTRTVSVNVLPLVPTQPAPQADLQLRASPAFIGASAAATATATVTNNGCAAVTGVDVTLHAPDGWTVQPASPHTIDNIDPGDSATVTWQVHPPANPGTGTGDGGPQLSATATYGWRTDSWQGQTTGSARAQTNVVVCDGTPPSVDPNARAQWDLTLGCAADLTGRGHDGAVGAGVSFTDAGASFNGTQQGAITVPYGADYQPESIGTGQTWTLNLTGVVPAKVGPDYQAVANARSTSAGYATGWTVYLNPSGTFQVWMSQVNHPNSSYAIASSGVRAEPGKRYDITVRWNGSQLSITVSGDASGSGSATPDGGYLPINAAPMTLGEGRSASAADYFFTGTLTSAKITVQ